ncbi:hypothetical protein B0F90DRAFT_1627989 [Multifurca ochricompacta]|uniref:IMD domain-containing protein n=1 Tax=Multifurca ochricompacta TaxID=376703 RepID=A0AAD4QLF3_9AGAM|nr:hypothetical protein B0F90DRAFT_1627989 [Multifurca ochricompacta]
MTKSRPLRALAIATNSQTKRSGSPGPPSPTFSDTTNISAVNFGEDGPAKIITRSDLKASMQSYENLLNSCSNYQSALLTMSRATAAFADAMESCAGMKGPSYEQGTRLQASAGLHHLMANHWHVLSETLDKQFEKPLRQHLDTYRAIVHERSSSYERALREKSHIIRETETRNMNRKERNLQSFREALSVLQRQVDDLDQLKSRHYEEIIEHEEEVWDVVQGKISLVVRSSLDVFDRFTAKASDPVIEPMLQSIPDPFDSYGQPHSEDQIFSILPPLSILAPSSSPSPLAVTPQTVTSDVFATGTSAGWAHGNGALYSDAASEWADVVPSASSSHLTNPTKPQSPSPSRRPNRSSSPPGSSTRRAESKLRSVLSVIDEAQPKQVDDALPPGVADTEAAETPAASGPSGTRDGGTNWHSFPFGEYPRSGSQDTTPRNSASESESPTFDANVSIDMQGRSTPESDSTTLPISS